MIRLLARAILIIFRSYPLPVRGLRRLLLIARTIATYTGCGEPNSCALVGRTGETSTAQIGPRETNPLDSILIACGQGPAVLNNDELNRCGRAGHLRCAKRLLLATGWVGRLDLDMRGIGAWVVWQTVLLVTSIDGYA
jgi:hypothetical protein